MNQEMEFDKEFVDVVVPLLHEYNYNYEKIAKKLSISIGVIEAFDICWNRKYNFTNEGIGPKHLQRYLIAKRNVLTEPGWDNKDPKVHRARELYDEGVVELTTGRDGLNMLLYAIPRRVKSLPRDYFQLKNIEDNNNVVHLRG